MALTDFLDRLTLTRRLVRSMERMATAIEAQNTLLARLADHFVPVIPEPTEEQIRTSGAEVRNQGRLARMEEWLETFRERVGREPDDTDIEEWLAEDAERTTA